MSTALLQTTYFGPIQWYQKLYRYDQTLIEQYDSYQKQTYRNRCVIATANGLQALTVPVEHDTLNIKNEILKVKDLRISDHNNWRATCWIFIRASAIRPTSAFSLQPSTTTEKSSMPSTRRLMLTSSRVATGKSLRTGMAFRPTSPSSTSYLTWEMKLFFIYKPFKT